MNVPPPPTVSVIVPAHNAMPYLTRCLDSVLVQTLGVAQMEVVVVDDGSTDGTSEEIDRWVAAHPGLVRAAHQAASGGPAAPRNTGLDMAEGRYVFFLDADDHLGREALDRLVRVADDNGSDVVLGRMASNSDRGVPRSMFRHTDLDADLFESRVYWTLAPLKLFRRDFIEKHGLRFPEHFPNCSDQPFTASAYLRARKISVLSDYDYYFAEYRDDGNHVTRAGSVSNRLDVVEAMCDLLAGEVPDAEKRGRLLLRHFQIDLRGVLGRILTAPESEQKELLPRVARLVRTHLDGRIAAALAPGLRLTYHLAGRERFEEALVAGQLELDEESYDVLVEDDRAFALMPYFRSPELSVPDECYEITGRLRADQRLTAVSWDGTSLSLEGDVRLHRVNPSLEDEIEVVLRRRGDQAGSEVRCPARRLPEGRFAAEVDLVAVAEGRPLTTATWEAYVRIAKGGLNWTVRLADRGSAAAALPRPSLRYAAVGRRIWTATAFLTGSGNLAVDVGRRKFTLEQALGDLTARWDGTDLVVSARPTLELAAPLTLVLRPGRGERGARCFPVTAENGLLCGRVSAHELPEGMWFVRLRVGVPPAHTGLAVPADGSLAPLRWGSALRRTHVLPSASRGGLVLEVTRAGILRRARQWGERLVHGPE